jgi:hypothetical protein
MADDFLTRYLAEQQQRRQEAGRAVRASKDLLQRLGVKQVTIRYDGSGDSGVVESVVFDPQPPAGIPAGLTELLSEVAVEFLPGGWEDNEGSYGELELDVTERRLRRNHYWRTIDEDDDEFDLDEE